MKCREDSCFSIVWNHFSFGIEVFKQNISVSSRVEVWGELVGVKVIIYG